MTESNDDLAALLDRVRHRPISNEERQAQRLSFAYGNVKLSNATITRADVESAAKRIDMSRPIPTSLLPELLDVLADGPLSTRELAKVVGRRRNTVRHHLKQGRDHFVTFMRRISDGKKVWRKNDVPEPRR